MSARPSPPQHDPRIWPQVDEWLADVVRERDELLAALKDAATWLDPGPCGQHACEGCLCEMQLAYDRIAAAIAKAKS
jgi:hypothetical protein